MINTSLRKQNKLFRAATTIWMKKSLLVDFISFLLITLFLYTGIAKLMDFNVFIEQLSESPILKPFASAIAWGLPYRIYRCRFVVLYSLAANWIICSFRADGYIYAICNYSTHYQSKITMQLRRNNRAIIMAGTLGCKHRSYRAGICRH